MAQYDLRVDESKHYISCMVEGVLSAKDLKVLALALYEFRQVSGIDLICIDLRKASITADAFENYRFVNNELTQISRPGSAKSAVLVRNDDAVTKFLDTMMKNASYKVQSFTDETLALNWLLAGVTVPEAAV